MSGETLFVQGNEACARGALYAGLKFFAGYPITPSTEIAETLAELLPRVGGKFVQMEDELASMCAVCGASIEMFAHLSPHSNVALAMQSLTPRSKISSEMSGTPAFCSA